MICLSVNLLNRHSLHSSLMLTYRRSWFWSAVKRVFESLPSEPATPHTPLQCWADHFQTQLSSPPLQLDKNACGYQRCLDLQMFKAANFSPSSACLRTLATPPFPSVLGTGTEVGFMHNGVVYYFQFRQNALLRKCYPGHHCTSSVWPSHTQARLAQCHALWTLAII